MPADAWTARDSRRALRRRLARSADPADWLVLADLLEEAGEADASRLWRRRGEWWPELHAALWSCAVGRRGRRLGAVAGPFWVSFRRCPASVRVELFWDATSPAGEGRRPVMLGEGREWSSLWYVSEDGTGERLRKKLDRNLWNVVAYLAWQEMKRGQQRGDAEHDRD